MNFTQGRVWAKTADDAARKIRDKWGDGRLTLREIESHRKGLRWFEFIIDFKFRGVEKPRMERGELASLKILMSGSHQV